MKIIFKVDLNLYITFFSLYMYQYSTTFRPNNQPITDPPQVTLSLGSTLKPDDIKEGDDVYFECHIKANPKEHRITWSHNVSIISTRISYGKYF